MMPRFDRAWQKCYRLLIAFLRSRVYSLTSLGFLGRACNQNTTELILQYISLSNFQPLYSEKALTRLYKKRAYHNLLKPITRPVNSYFISTRVILKGVS